MKLFPISRAAVEGRQLMPIYRFGNSPMAWECAACGKFFSISVAEAEESAQLPPPYVEREFRLHNCELHLCERFSGIDVARTGAMPGADHESGGPIDRTDLFHRHARLQRRRINCIGGK